MSDPDDKETGVVTFCEEDLRWHVFKSPKSNYCNRNFDLEPYKQYYNELEIIGNIYEDGNPLQLSEWEIESDKKWEEQKAEMDRNLWNDLIWSKHDETT